MLQCLNIRWLPIILALSASLLTAMVPAAWARVSGALEWEYVGYNEKSGEDAEKEASHFFQNYSLMYDTQGVFAGGRGGAWDFGVGAEWASFTSDLDGDQYSRDSMKFLYKGEFLFAPGGLPIRVHAYSHDQQHITLLQNRIEAGPFFYPQIADDLLNGQTIETGLQLMLGIRNGSYLGTYRELLSQFPRLLMDYREVYHRDMDALDPQKTRNRNLAFVSLNKKDNWFHYRVNDYRDYLDPRQDFREEQFIIGTIDHTLRRQWIWLTNWVRLSTDGSYTIINHANEAQEEQTFALNLFTSMDRNGLHVDNFANYQRERIGNSLSQRLEIPILLTKEISPETSNRSFASLYRKNDAVYGQDANLEDDDYFLSTVFQTRKRNLVRIDPRLEMEYRSSSYGTGQAVRTAVEAYSNQLYRKPVNWHGNLSLARFDGSRSDVYEGTTDYWEATAGGQADWQFRSNLKLYGSQKVLFGFGDFLPETTRYLVPDGSSDFRSGYANTENVSDKIMRSYTVLGLEQTSGRARNRLEARLDLESNAAENQSALELEHRFDYSVRNLYATSTTTFRTGDIDTEMTGNASALGGAAETVTTLDRQLFHRSRLRYQPSREWDTTAEARLEWRQASDGLQSTWFTLMQRMKRNFYTVNGVIRKIAALQQTLEYDQYLDGVDISRYRLGFYGNYYPNRQFSLGAGVVYTAASDYDGDVVVRLSAGMDYPKFKVELRYDYGTTVDGALVAHRYEVNVKKTF